MLPRRILLLGTLALALSPGAARADDDPVTVVRELYRVHAEREKTKQLAWQPPHGDRFFTRNLAQFIARAHARNGIDFDFIYDAQDFQISDLAVELGGTRGGASVQVSFKNFGKPQRLTYGLVRERGAWRVAEIVKTGPDGWVLTKLLAKR